MAWRLINYIQGQLYFHIIIIIIIIILWRSRMSIFVHFFALTGTEFVSSLSPFYG
jgi:hypothetical protein